MKEFYLRSRHGNCGTNLMFHNKNGAGYGSDLDNLETYSLEDAQKELNHGIANLPLLKSAVDELSIKAVDCQYIKNEDNHTDPNDQYVVQVKGLWDGNDIAFMVIGYTFNYSEAHVFSYSDAVRRCEGHEKFHSWSKYYLDTLCRRTFQEENINTRKMITGPGLKYKKPRKQRPTTGKERWNCPSCGKINWQFNPYDFDGCAQVECELWQPSHRRNVIYSD